LVSSAKLLDDAYRTEKRERLLPAGISKVLEGIAEEG